MRRSSGETRHRPIFVDLPGFITDPTRGIDGKYKGARESGYELDDQVFPRDSRPATLPLAEVDEARPEETRRSRKPLCRASGTGGSNPPLSASESQYRHFGARSEWPGFRVFRASSVASRGQTHRQQTDERTPDIMSGPPASRPGRAPSDGLSGGGFLSAMLVMRLSVYRG